MTGGGGGSGDNGSADGRAGGAGGGGGEEGDGAESDGEAERRADKSGLLSKGGGDGEAGRHGSHAMGLCCNRREGQAVHEF